MLLFGALSSSYKQLYRKQQLVFNSMATVKVKQLSQATPSSYEYICFVLTFCSQRNAVS